MEVVVGVIRPGGGFLGIKKFAAAAISAARLTGGVDSGTSSSRLRTKLLWSLGICFLPCRVHWQKWQLAHDCPSRQPPLRRTCLQACPQPCGWFKLPADTEISGGSSSVLLGLMPICAGLSAVVESFTQKHSWHCGQSAPFLHPPLRFTCLHAAAQVCGWPTDPREITWMFEAAKRALPGRGTS